MANRSAGLVRFLDRENAQTGANQPAGTVTVMDVYASVAAERITGSTLASNVVNSSLTSLSTVTSGTWHGTPVTVPYGGTGLTSLPAGSIMYANESNQLVTLAGNITTTPKFLQQTGDGVNPSAPVWDTFSGSAATGQPLTALSDDNVTLTLGGTPSTALLGAASITAGWTGALSIARGGTGLTSTTLGDLLYSSGSNTLSTLTGNITTTRKFLRQLGTGAVSDAPGWDTITAADVPGSALTVVSDSNVTLTLDGTPSTALLGATSITAGWTNTLTVARGGTGQSTYTDGQLLIGNSSTGQLSKANITGSNITVSNGNGTIQVSLPQAVATTSSPSFSSLGLGTAALSSSTGLYIFKIFSTTAGTSLFSISTGSAISVTAGTTPIAAACSLGDSVATSVAGVATIAASLYTGGSFGTSGASRIDTAASVYLKPNFTNTAGTMTLACGLYVKPNAITGTTVIPTFAGVYSDTVAATGTVTAGYGGYFKAPTGCANAVALYADSLNVNVAPAGTTATLGRINCNSLRATNGGVIVGLAALATNSVTGFLYIPTCAGVPTAVPNAQSGTAPLVFDTTNNNLYVYNTTWKKTTVFA